MVRPPDSDPLARFVPGSENVRCWRAAQRLIAQPCGSLPALVLLHGPARSGKTLLLRGITQAIKRQHPSLELWVCHAQRWTRRVQGLHHRRELSRLSSDFMELVWFALDDVHLLAGREAAQRALIALLDPLLDRGGQALFTSQHAVGALDTLIAPLSSRMSAGLALKLDPPSASSRLTIVRRAALAAGVDLSDSLTQLIVERLLDLDRLPLLMSVLYRIAARQPLCAPLVEAALVQLGASAPTDTAAIAAAVASHYGLEPRLLCARRGQRQRDNARNLAIWLARQAGRANEEIARVFELSRDSVVTAVRRTSKRLASDPTLAAELAALGRAIGLQPQSET